jgi:uroporphyrinogen decarboxylase
MAGTGAAALGVDWTMSPEFARKQSGMNITLQGNLDPARLLSPLPDLKKEISRMMNAFGPERHIANLGHGILPGVPVDHARAFVDTVRNHVFSTKGKEIFYTE